MQLHAVIVPPPTVVEDAFEAARALLPEAPVAAEEPTPGRLGRFLGRRQPPPPPMPVVSMVPAEPAAVFIRLAKFGNVTVTDAEGLAAALQVVARNWQVPILRASTFAVAAAHPFDVTAQLDGDLDALGDIFANVNEVARVQRFFLDRRSFRAELFLGTIETPDGAPTPEVAGAELEHQGPQWSPTHITLLRTSFSDGGTTFAEYARVELADAAEDLGARTGA